MLDHAYPAVVGALGVWRLARRVRGELVELPKLDFLELVGFVVDDGPGIRSRRHRALNARRLGVAGELKVGVRGDWSGPGIGDLVSHVDDVAPAMERER